MAEELRKSKKAKQAKVEQQMKREQAKLDSRKAAAGAEGGAGSMQTVTSRHFSGGSEVEKVEMMVEEEEDQDDDADDGLVTMDDPTLVGAAEVCLHSEWVWSASQH